MNISKPVKEIKKNIFSSYKNCLKNYFNFKTRSSRYDYWSFLILNTVIASVLSTLGKFYVIFATLYLLYLLILIIPSIAITLRRLHDINKSAWFFIVSFIPIFNIYFLYVLTKKGDVNENKYGKPVAEDKRCDVIGKRMAIGYYTFIVLLFGFSLALYMSLTQ